MFVLAGHNGAGKSTCYKTYLHSFLGPLESDHMDPDAIEREIRAGWVGEAVDDVDFSRMAQREAHQRRMNHLFGGDSFSFETVASHPSKVEIILQARKLGYVVALMFVGIESAEKSQQRVTARVAAGGHDVPPEKIVDRYPRVLENMRDGIRAASLALIVDNSQDANPRAAAYRPIALLSGGKVLELISDPPTWTTTLLLK